jgi:hypothetical protein
LEILFVEQLLLFIHRFAPSSRSIAMKNTFCFRRGNEESCANAVHVRGIGKTTGILHQNPLLFEMDLENGILLDLDFVCWTTTDWDHS